MLKNHFLWITLLIFSGLVTKVNGQINSVLSEGSWIKIAIENENIYRLSYSDLQSFGLDPNEIDPETIRLYGNGGGMLPQANNIERPFDLLEVPIYISGADDNSFDSQDYILFWGEGSDKIEYDSLNQTFNYQNHLHPINYHFF